jgi:hypothetical protein
MKEADIVLALLPQMDGPGKCRPAEPRRSNADTRARSGKRVLLLRYDFVSEYHLAELGHRELTAVSNALLDYRQYVCGL